MYGNLVVILKDFPKIIVHCVGFVSNFMIPC